MNPASRFGAWCRRYFRPSDAVLTLGCLLTIAISGSLSDTAGLFAFYGQTAQTLWGLALMVPALFRRWRPQACAIAFVVICAVQLIAGPAVVLSDALAMVMLYSAIVYGKPEHTRRFIVLALIMGTLAALVMALSTIGPLNSTPMRSCVADGTWNCLGSFAQTAAAVGAGIGICLGSTIVIAYWTRARLTTIDLLRERNASIEAREGEERHIAALAERARIARDMHDVVAHTLSIIIVQSDAGRYAGIRNSTVARATMETIRHESERALHDMRRVLGMLGGSSHADYDDIGSLLDQAQTASPDSHITRRITGTPTPQSLTPRVSGTLYHIVQESLTNVRKYAGPHAAVQIEEQWQEHGIAISVCDNGRGAGAAMDGHQPGYGLIGMRERVESVRGTLSCGPRIGGGFEVQAFVPYAKETQRSGANASAHSPMRGTERSSDIGQLHDATNRRIQPLQHEQALEDPTHGACDAVLVAAAASHDQAVSPDGDLETSYIGSDAPQSPVDRICPNPNQSQGSAPLDSTGPDDLPANARAIPSLRSHNANGPATTANNERRSTSVPIPIVLRTRLVDIMQLLHSKPLRQAGPQHGGEFNWVERLSQWTERHYLMVDTISTLLLIAIALISIFSGSAGYDDPKLTAALALLLLLPLALRRRAPEFSAACIATLCALMLLFVPSTTVMDVFALLSLYSVTLYGAARSRRWVWAAAGINSALVGVKITVSYHGYVSIINALLNIREQGHYESSGARDLFIGAGFSMIVAILCVATIALALWARSSGANALVLQTREEALRAEREQQKVLAANLERDRISASIQAEVTHTLTGVIDQAIAGLRMLDDYESHGQEPSPEELSSAFTDIGARGRSALADMRQLLGVLRETGFSDAAQPVAIQRDHAMQLEPPKNLDEQFEATTPTA
ncbi:MAG: histidine kinase [Bifidobacterium sp.]|jgi:signal transduction histidine kinase|nr:histidine kinase [Bifidobacterium sp.]